MEKITLGHKVKDKVTGYTGIAISKCIYLNGCVQYCVQSKHEKGVKLEDGAWIDEGQLEIVDKGVFEKPKPIKKEIKTEPWKSRGGGHRSHPK